MRNSCQPEGLLDECSLFNESFTEMTGGPNTWKTVVVTVLVLIGKRHIHHPVLRNLDQEDAQHRGLPHPSGIKQVEEARAPCCESDPSCVLSPFAMRLPTILSIKQPVS